MQKRTKMKNFLILKASFYNDKINRHAFTNAPEKKLLFDGHGD